MIRVPTLEHVPPYGGRRIHLAQEAQAEQVAGHPLPKRRRIEQLSRDTV